ncbi:MAG: response regulator transcription factor [Bacteroidota bacterium]
MGDQHIKVLLAEDDFNLGNILKNYLEAKGFPTNLFENGKEAFEGFMHDTYSFCVIDIMMPVKDGFTLAKEIRAINKKIPILFLTAKSMQEDILKAFDIGADDYLTKPFSMEELLVRMNAIMRRSMQAEGQNSHAIYTFGKSSLDYVRQILVVNGIEQKLTSKEAELLKLLCDNLNEVLDRTYTLKRIWHDDSYFNARSMDVYITKLRKFLKEDDTLELINVHGVGFKLVVTNE